MAGDRIVVGSTDDEDVRTAAQALRDAGHEVVFVGGGQTPEQLVRTALAEDAGRIAVGTGDAGTLELIAGMCAAMGLDDVGIERLRCDAFNAP